ncbi:MAG: phosphopantothenoylcysteine decarboxylase, partial [Pseudomonadota bacterium]
FGPGRLPEVDAIAAEIEQAVRGCSALQGVHALVTAGPTREPIDPVRYLSNHSSGRQGYDIAEALAGLGARVTLVSGPVSIDPPVGVDLIKVETAREMLAACEEALPADVFVSVAAVADWRPAQAAARKLKLKNKADPAPAALNLKENPDILATLARKKTKRPGLVVGFAAETNDIETHAREKLKRKRCDWIVANDVSGDVMGGQTNQVSLISATEIEHWPLMDKAEVARRLAGRVAEYLDAGCDARGSKVDLAAE